MSHWLLVSDLDNTLDGDSDAWAELTTELAESPDIYVVLNSSRPWKSVIGTMMGNYPQLSIKGAICGMGTKIIVDGRALSQWSLRFSGWDRSIVDRTMKRLGFAPHPQQLQTAYKASFTVPRGSSQALARNALASVEQDCQIIASGESDFDVLPPRAGKGAATLFLADYLGIPLDRTIVAGDSANDHAMFDVAQKGIIVGNARAELRHAVDPAKVYFAQGACAAGVREGLRFWGAPLKQIDFGALAGKE